jgi:hypothetical protein
VIAQHGRSLSSHKFQVHRAPVHALSQKIGHTFEGPSLDCAKLLMVLGCLLHAKYVRTQLSEGALSKISPCRPIKLTFPSFPLKPGGSKKSKPLIKFVVRESQTLCSKYVHDFDVLADVLCAAMSCLDSSNLCYKVQRSHAVNS